MRRALLRAPSLWLGAGASGSLVAAASYAQCDSKKQPACVSERTFIAEPQIMTLFNHLTTLFIDDVPAVKPDGMNRALAGEVIQRFEQKGYKLVACKLIKPSRPICSGVLIRCARELLALHYAEHSAKSFFPQLLDFMSSGPVMAMVFEGNQVIKTGRLMIGKTSGFDSPAGTIRGDHAVGIYLANVVHGSDSKEAATREIKLWFPEASELIDWEPTFFKWTMW